jgi:hypothetical protein
MAKKDEERARRLAAALRENLKRRKAQAREVALQGKASPGDSSAVDPSKT